MIYVDYGVRVALIRYFGLLLLLVNACTTAKSSSVPTKVTKKSLTQNIGPIKKFWGDFQSRESAFDSTISELFAEDAALFISRIMPDGTIQNQTVQGSTFQAEISERMSVAKSLNDQIAYSDVRYNSHLAEYEITAIRSSSWSCFVDNTFYAKVQKSTDGRLQIKEAKYTSSALSVCPDVDPQPMMKSYVETLSHQLPVRVGEDSVLEQLSLDNNLVRFDYKLLDLKRDQIDVEGFIGQVTETVRHSSCSNPVLRQLLDNGVSLGFQYRDKEDDELVHLSIDEMSCI